MKALVFAGECLLATGLLVPAANAHAIPSIGEEFAFTGTGFQSSNRFRFDISGDDFLYSISTSEGPLIVANCTPGASCSFEQGYNAGVLSAFDLVQVSASLDGVSTNSVTGLLLVGGAVTPPTAPGAFQATIPMPFTGDVIGHFFTEGFPVAFDVALDGAGTAVLGGVVIDSSLAVVNSATYTFSGTGTVKSAAPPSEIPEPSAMALAAGGAGLLGLLLRRRRPM